MLLAIIMVSTLALTGCNRSEGEMEPISRDIFAMDTYMTVSVYEEENSEEVLDAAVKEINRLDALLSTGKDTSEVSQLNANGGGELSEDTAALLEEALKLYEETNHVFDITIYPVMRAWGFTTGDYMVPDYETLDETLKLVDASTLDYDKETKTVDFTVEGTEIDFGGIAKGYTSDSVCAIYRDLGMGSGLVNLGGNVQTVGLRPDGSEWNIGIRHPSDENAMLGVVTTHDTAVITSGGYERNFEEDGIVYHHIIDPTSGYPAESGLISVTIVSESGVLADALSTSLFIMGKEKAVEFWQAHQDEFDFILCQEDGSLVVSGGLEGKFKPYDEETNVEYIEAT